MGTGITILLVFIAVVVTLLIAVPVTRKIAVDNKIKQKGERNAYAEKFSYAVTHSIKSALCDAGGYDLKTKKNTVISRAADLLPDDNGKK